MNVRSMQKEATYVSDTGKVKQSLDEWHRIFGHISKDSVEMLAKSGMVMGMEIANQENNWGECQTCIKTKGTRFLVPKESLTKYDKIGDLIISDIWGRSRIKGL